MKHAGTRVDVDQAAAGLKRSLSLPLLVLYGLGVTVGAGIYVLIGASAARAGVHAPVSFLIAAGVMALTATSFAELTSRMPVSAGEAAYVRNGFRSETLSLIVGLLVVTVGTVSASAIAIGSAGYIKVFVSLPSPLVITLIVLAMGLVAAWGIMESVTFAGVMTGIEIVGLLIIVGAGVLDEPWIAYRAVAEVLPSLADGPAWSGILAAGLLAFFAFVGFEDLVNVAEEARDPLRNMPRAIFLTLILATALYFCVVTVAVLSVPIDELAASEAPLSFVFERLTGASPVLIAGIAIIATLNGIIIQMIMASRVIYGLAAQGTLPSSLAAINPQTRTPLRATLLVVTAILALALIFPITGLAETTSRITLVIFALVNVALIRIKMRGETPTEKIFLAPFWVPYAGCGTCVLFLASSFL
ncbi:MAG: APC family permease [Hyphomicrobiaceae bacterium]